MIASYLKPSLNSTNVTRKLSNHKRFFLEKKNQNMVKPLLVSIFFLLSIVALPEKPSNLASIGRYVLTPDIFETLRSLSAGSGGEIQLADAINKHARQGSVETVRLNGRRFDCGSVDGFMNAIQYMYSG